MKAILTLLLLLMVLTACSNGSDDGANDLPPPPRPPGSSSISIFNPTGMVVMDLPSWAAPASSGFTITPQTFEPNIYQEVEFSVSDEELVYMKYFILINDQWKESMWNAAPIPNTMWARGSVKQTAKSTWFAGEYPVIVYACSKVDGIWNCHDNKWMMNTIIVESPAKLDLTFRDVVLSSFDAANQILTPLDGVSPKMLGGLTLTAKVNIVNIGDWESYFTEVRSLVTKSDGTVIFDRKGNVPKIAPGGSYPMGVLGVGPLSEGTYTVELTLDPAGVLDEKDETNNKVKYTVVVESNLPDLQISSQGIGGMLIEEVMEGEMRIGNYAYGQPLKLHGDVINMGGPAGQSTFGVSVAKSDGSPPKEFKDPVPSLKLYDSSDSSVWFMPPEIIQSPGLYQALFKADFDSAVVESDETNNIGYIYFRILEDVPDLPSFDFGSGSPVPGNMSG